MSRFHITKAGKPAKCNATEKACPLDSAHFDSMKDAMDELNEQELFGTFHQDASTYADLTKGYNFDTVELKNAPTIPTITPTELREYRVDRANAEQEAFINSVFSE